LEEIVQLLVKGGSEALDKMMYVKDFLMNLMTRESWNKNAKAGLDQIRDTLNPKKKKKNKQIQVDREYLEHLLGNILCTQVRVLERMNFGTMQYTTFQSVRIETKVSKLSKYYDSHWAGMIQLLSEERYVLLPIKRQMVAILGDILKYLMSLD